MDNTYSKMSLTNQQHRESMNGDVLFHVVEFGKLGLGE